MKKCYFPSWVTIHFRSVYQKLFNKNMKIVMVCNALLSLRMKYVWSYLFKSHQKYCSLPMYRMNVYLPIYILFVHELCRSILVNYILFIRYRHLKFHYLLIMFLADKYKSMEKSNWSKLVLIVIIMIIYLTKCRPFVQEKMIKKLSVSNL